MEVILIFVNRINELRAINESLPGLFVVFGRRRVGKTALVQKWAKDSVCYYSQAIEGAEAIQVSQVMADLRDLFPEGVRATSWLEFFPLLALITKKCTVVLDEFPYLVRSAPSLPSIAQKWLDHSRPPQMSLILLGSSQTMMNSIFLDSRSPLYERANLILHLEPMTYRCFCLAVDMDHLEPESFEKFSLVGGVPRYWSYVHKQESVEFLADRLFFGKSAVLEFEPDRLLRDEDISGMQAKSIFECIGRGANKPSQIAGRIGIPQTALSKPMQILMHTSLIQRVVPFGESTKSPKRTLYTIADFALKFWYGCYSPHRSRWHLYTTEEKQSMIHQHAASVLEESYRRKFPDSARYWEGSELEFDCVRHSARNPNEVVITEIKHRTLGGQEKASIEQDLIRKFSKSKLATKFEADNFEVMDTLDILRALDE